MMRSFIAFPATALTIILCGCAAVRIDVDVYKGPLANHEDIQVRQYAALAIAARPVLASMRNRLEEKDGRNPVFTKLSRQDKEKFVPGHLLTNETARFINGALSFYQDTSTPEVAAAVEAAIGNYYAALRGISILDGQRARDAELGRALLQRYPASSQPARYERPQDLRWLFGNQQGELLLGTRKLEKVPSACENTKGRADSGTDRWIGRGLEIDSQCACRALSRYDRTLQCASDRSTNSAFSVMESPLALATQSRALFGEPHEGYDTRMMERATAFRKSREALRGIWLSVLSLVELLAETGAAGQREAAARALAQVSQPRFLACYLTTQGAVRVQGELSRILYRGGLYGVRTQEWGPSDYVAANLAVEEGARLYPKAMAALLRSGDNAFSTMPLPQRCQALNVTDFDALVDESARRYGFARGPTLDDGFANALKAMESSLSAISAGSAGFDRARPVAGIENLFTGFMAALSTSGNDVSHSDVVKARRRLEESLIQWAERILIVVNNRAMLQPEAENKELAREVAVIQAVANTVILNADDMRRRDAHGQRQLDRAGAERSGVQQAFAISASQSFDLMLKEIRSGIERQRASSAAPAPVDPNLQSQVAKAQDDQAKLRGDLQDLVDAAATLQGHVAGVALRRDDVGARADSAAIARQVQALPTTSSFSTVLSTITTWIDKERTNVDFSLQPAVSPRLQRLEGARKYLTAAALKDRLTALEASVKPASRAGYFSALQARLAASTSESALYVARKAGELSTLEAKLETTKGAGKAAQFVEDAQGALEALAQVRGDALNEADAFALNDGRAIQTVTLRLLTAKAKMLTAGSADRKKYDSAIQAVTASAPSPALALSAAGARTARQVDITDDLLSLLRARRVQALSTGNTNSAADYQAAIKYLMEQRADMAYLRPASAYLKSAYASTSLQSNPDVGWVNMLARNTGRSIFGAQPSEYDKEFLATTAEIDKQFWQNINTVNLSGGGRVNYVLAKDDVGNWYVKAYSVDPSDIFKSAQGLALFGMGKRIDVNLLRRAQLQRQLDSTETDEGAKEGIRKELATQTDKPSAAGGSALTGVVQRYRSQYESRTRDDATALQQSVLALGKGIRAAWGDNLAGTVKDDMLKALEAHVPASGVLSALAASSDALKSALDKTDGDSADRARAQARALIAGLDAVRRLRTQLDASIRGDLSLVQGYSDALKTQRDAVQQAKKDRDALVNPSDADKQKASDAVGTEEKKLTAAEQAFTSAQSNRILAAEQVRVMCNELIQQASARRLDTIKETDTAFTFVGQAAGAAP